MEIENSLFGVFNAMIKSKKDWIYVTDKQKEEFFFIINRYFSKKFPQKSQLLNNKLIDKVSAMDTWYLFMLDKSYPKWFWSKSTPKQKLGLKNDEVSYLTNELDLKMEDIEIIMKYYPDIIKEELKYFASVKKSNKS
mgnify:CR=1 FL=1